MIDTNLKADPQPSIFSTGAESDPLLTTFPISLPSNSPPLAPLFLPLLRLQPLLLSSNLAFFPNTSDITPPPLLPTQPPPKFFAPCSFSFFPSFASRLSSLPSTITLFPEQIRHHPTTPPPHTTSLLSLPPNFLPSAPPSYPSLPPASPPSPPPSPSSPITSDITFHHPSSTHNLTLSLPPNSLPFHTPPSSSPSVLTVVAVALGLAQRRGGIGWGLICEKKERGWCDGGGSPELRRREKRYGQGLE